MQQNTKKSRLKLKTLHDQARDIQRLENRKERAETEVLDQSILDMIQKENDIIYNDDYEYFQFYGKKKRVEDNWVEQHKEDEKKYRSLKSKLVIT